MLALAPASAQATVRYVDGATGVNNSDCDAAASPCDTITYAVGQAVTGVDEIRIAAGTYPESVATDKILTFAGAGPSTIVAPTPDGASAFNVSKGGTFRNLDARGNDGSLTGGSGILSQPTTSGSYTLRLENVNATGGDGASLPGGRGVTAAPTLPATQTLIVTGGTFAPGAGPLGGAAGIYAYKAPATLTDVTVEGAAPNAEGIHLNGAQSTVTDSFVETVYGITVDAPGATIARTAVFGRLAGLTVTPTAPAAPASANVSDSLIVLDSPSPAGLGEEVDYAVRSISLGDGDPTINLNGSTVIARGAGADAAIGAFKLSSAGTLTPKVAAVNTVARLLDSAEPLGADLLGDRGTVTMSSSAFATSRAANGGSVPAPGSGTTADPLFTNPDGDDFSLRAGSPLIDRGAPTASTLDFDLRPRSLDGNGDCVAAPDIGAFERAVVGVLLPCPRVANARPVLSKASLLRKRFTARKPRSKRRKNGTRIRFTLSEAAKVKLSFALKSKGRKVRSQGKTKCAKPTRKNRKRKRCTRYVLKGSFTVNGKAGKNDLKFSGKVGKRTLKPGTYRLTLVATDPKGLKSKQARLAFRVLRP